jgi:hypothetical protein
MADVRERVDGALAGHGQLILFVGEPGIGKTRLAAELVAHARGQGARALFASCDDSAGAPALWPWAQVVRAYLDAAGAITVRENLGSSVRDLARLVPELDATSIAAPVDDAAAARFRLFDALARFVTRASEREPLCIVLDDLHWADPPSLRALEIVARAVRDARVVLVGTYRDVDVAGDPTLAPLFASLARVGHCVPLAGLGPEDLASLVTSLADATPSTALLASLHLRTGGNPFFVREVVRLLIADAPIDAPDAATRLAQAVPETVRLVIEQRLARVDEVARATLSAAAVLGQTVRADLLARVTGVDEIVVADALERAARAQLVVACTGDAAGAWTFAHALVRDTLYAGLRAASRAALHARAAEALDGVAGAHLAEVAHHALRGGPEARVRGVASAERAGDHALGLFAHDLAAGHFEAALSGLPAAGAERPRARLLLKAGDARRRMGDLATARHHFQEAARLADVLGDAKVLAEAALGYSEPRADFGLAFRAADADSVALLERALAATAGHETPDRVRLLDRLAVELYFSGPRARTASLTRQALELARRVGDPGALVEALGAHHDTALVGSVDVVAAREAATEMVELAERTGDRRAALAAHLARLIDLVVEGDRAAVDVEIDAFRRLAEALRAPAYTWYPKLWRAMLALLDARFEEAERLSLEAFEAGQASEPVLAQWNFNFQLFFLRFEQGRLGELEPFARAFADQNPEQPAMRAALALIFAETGQLEAADAELARIERDSFAALRDRNLPVSWFLASLACAKVGDRDRAEVLFAVGSPLREQCVLASIGAACAGAAAFALGRLAETLGRVTEARDLYGQARVRSARIGARAWMARAQAEHARLAGPESAAGAALASNQVFRRQGDTWLLSFAGLTAHVKDTKGLGDLAALLACPGQPISAFTLASAGGAPGGAARPPEAEALAGGGLERADREAIAAYRARVAELDDEIEEAGERADAGCLERARVEREALLDELGASVGLGGRARTTGGWGERARKAVSMRIRSTIQRIERHHPPLAAHLARCVQTGSECVYRPDESVAWSL